MSLITARNMGLAALVTSGLCAGVWLGTNLYLGLFARIVPKRKVRPRRNPLQHCGRNYQDITIITSDKIRLSGWYVPGSPELPTVIICHPYESSKYASLHRLALLPPECPALLFDGRAHGQSGGEEFNFLHGEFRDLEAVLEHGASTLGLRRFVLWGRCWNTLAVGNLAAQRKEVCAFILEGAVSSLLEASTETLHQLYDLPPWCFSLGMHLLQQRWGNGLSYKKLDDLGDALRGCHVLLVSEAFHSVSVQYAKLLRRAWPQAHVTELCLPTVHGGITDLAATLGPYRSRFADAVQALLERVR